MWSSVITTKNTDAERDHELFINNFVKLGRTPRGSCNRTLLRRILRRFFKGSAFLEGFLEGTL